MLVAPWSWNNVTVTLQWTSFVHTGLIVSSKTTAIASSSAGKDRKTCQISVTNWFQTVDDVSFALYMRQLPFLAEFSSWFWSAMSLVVWDNKCCDHEHVCTYGQHTHTLPASSQLWFTNWPIAIICSLFQGHFVAIEFQRKMRTNDLYKAYKKCESWSWFAHMYCRQPPRWLSPTLLWSRAKSNGLGFWRLWAVTELHVKPSCKG